MQNSTIIQESLSFDKNEQLPGYNDVTVNYERHGNTLMSVKLNGSKLPRPEAYTSTSNTVTLKKEFLKDKPNGVYTITLEMNQGEAPQTTLTVFKSSTISLQGAVFDKYESAPDYKDVTARITLNGNTLMGVKRGTEPLTQGTHYTVSAGGDEVTLKKEYLKTLAYGDHTFIFDMNDGVDPELTVKVIESSTIVQAGELFDRYEPAPDHKDVTVTLALNGNTLNGVKRGTELLTQDTHYTVSAGGDAVTLKKEYLKTLLPGDHTFTFDMNQGVDPELKVKVIESSTLDRVTALFDRYELSPNHQDVTVTIAVYTNTLRDVKLNGTALTRDVDYTVNANGDKVTLKKEYLATLPAGAQIFTFDMDVGMDPTLAVTIIESSTISPAYAEFDRYALSTNYKDVTVTLAVYTNTLLDVKLNGGDLVKGKDYTVNAGGNEVTLKKEYLETLPVDVHTFTFDMDTGMDPLLVVDIKDTTPPNPPANLTAVKGNRVVNLSWTTVTEATYYNVYVSEVQGVFGDQPHAMVTGTTYEVQNLDNGTTYYFVVKAVNHNGLSVPSNEVSATPAAVPLPPTQVQAKAGYRSATITFTAPADDGGSPITGYEVFDQNDHLVASAGADATSITVGGLTSGVTYTFTIRAQNAEGYSDPSAPSYAVTPYDSSSDDDVPPAEPVQEPEMPAPSVRLFNGSVVNEDELVQWFASRVEEAKAATARVEFADIAGHWAEETVRIFARLKLAEGYPDGTFKPDRPITRAEFAAILDRVFQIRGGNANAVLKDIADSWARESIEKLAASGLISGYPDGTFQPNQTITRQEMIVMLIRIVNLDNLEKDPAKGEFRDLDDAYAAEAIQEAAQAGIVSGKGNGVFDPNGNATRAEALQIILNVLKLKPELKELLESLGGPS